MRIFYTKMTTFTLQKMGTWLIDNIGPVNQDWKFLPSEKAGYCRIDIQNETLALQFKLTFGEYVH